MNILKVALLSAVFALSLAVGNQAVELATYSDEGDGGADRSAAIEAGFTEVVTGLFAPSSPEGQEIDRLFMSQIANSVAPGEMYGFTFAYLDVTGDGNVDLFLWPKMASLRPPMDFPQNGGALYVFSRDAAGDWKLVLEGGAIDVALRDNATTGAKDIALIQEYRQKPDYIPFTWNGGRFERIPLGN